MEKDKLSVFIIFCEVSNGLYSPMYKTSNLNNGSSELYFPIFNNSTLAKEFQLKTKNEFLENPSMKGFEGENLIVHEIIDQYQWDYIRNSLADDGVFTAVINPYAKPCFIEKINTVDYLKIPVNIEKYKNFSSLREALYKLPTQYITMFSEDIKDYTENEEHILLLNKKDNLLISTIKNIMKSIKSFLSYVLGILLALLLPFVLIWIWVKSIFSDNVKDHSKVEITKEAVIIFTILGFFIFMESLRDSKIWEYVLYLGIGVLVVLLIKQKFYDKK